MPFFRRKVDKNKATPSPQLTPKLARSRNSTDIHNVPVESNCANGDISGPQATSGDSSLYGWGKRPRTLLLQPENDPSIENGPKATTPVLTSSRLSKTLTEVLHDKDALPYFIQFMATRKGEHLIKFWLDAESFQASSWTRIRSHSLKSVRRMTRSSSSDSPSSDLPNTTCDSHNNGLSGTESATTDSDSDGGHQGVTAASTSAAHPGCSPPSVRSSSDEHLQPNLQSLATPVCNHVSNETSEADASERQTTWAGSCGVHGSRTSVGTDASTVPCGAACDMPAEEPLPSPHTECGPSHHPEDVHGSPPDEPHTAVPPVTDVSPPPPPSAAQSNPPLDDTPTSVSESNSTNHSPTLNTDSEDSFQEKLRKCIERDAVSIFTKYISQEATHSIGVDEDLRNYTISQICREDGQVDPQCFVKAQEFVVKKMEKDYYPAFAQSEFHNKHQIDILTGSEVRLADVLYNEVALFYFMEFMEQEGAMDLLQCWLAIDNFQQLLSERHSNYDGMEAQKDAMVIYDKYFSLQASVPLGFTDSVRFEVEANICREEGPLPDCFVSPKWHVLRTIEKIYFPSFLQSDIYYKYLSDLINTIQMAQDFPHAPRRKRTDSDASSEHSVGSQRSAGTEASISSRNTLLAADTRQMKKALNKFADDMRIDNSLLNPDNLWNRPQAGKMSLGHIDEVGQFVSELDPEPDHEKRPLAKFFKRKREDEKMQEEMALQIAQMIVNDITSTTQGSYTDLTADMSLGNNS